MTRRSLSHTALVAACGLAFAATAQAQQNTQKPQPRTETNRPRATENQNQNQNQNQSAEQRREAERNQNTRTTVREGQAAQEGSLDGQLAACLILGNEKEVAAARFAEQHSQNEQVKQFAQQMIEAHTKFADQLAQFAEQGGYQRQQLALDGAEGQQDGAQNPQGRQQTQNRPQGQEPRSTAQRPQQPTTPAAGNEATRRSARSEVLDQSGRSNDLIGIEREVAQQCIRSAQQELGQKQGAEFDECYTGMQIHEHQAMVDKLEVFSRHATGELQTVLQQGLQTAQQHLQHAKQLHEQIASTAGSKQSRSNQPGSQNKNEKTNENKNENK